MTTDVVTATPATTLRRAVELMAKHKLRRLPIVKGEELMGLVTESDVLRAVPADNPHLVDWEASDQQRDITVSKVMSPNPVKSAPSMLIEEAAALMEEHKISSLFVVDQMRLVGIITVGDVIRAFASLLRGGNDTSTAAVIEVADDGGLDEILKIVGSRDVRLLSLMTAPKGGQAGRWLVRIGLSGPNCEEALSALASAGYPVMRRIE
jgi:acetoin utilization protein AcuB